MLTIQKEQALDIIKDFNGKFSKETGFNLYLMGNYPDYSNLGIHLNKNEYMKNERQFIVPSGKFTMLVKDYFQNIHNIEIEVDYDSEPDCGYIELINKIN